MNLVRTEIPEHLAHLGILRLSRHGSLAAFGRSRDLRTSLSMGTLSDWLITLAVEMIMEGGGLVGRRYIGASQVYVCVCTSMIGGALNAVHLSALAVTVEVEMKALGSGSSTKTPDTTIGVSNTAGFSLRVVKMAVRLLSKSDGLRTLRWPERNGYRRDT